METIIFSLPLLIVIAGIWMYAYQKGVRYICPNCGQRQIGWSTQCPKCGVVFKDWDRQD